MQRLSCGGDRGKEREREGEGEGGVISDAGTDPDPGGKAKFFKSFRRLTRITAALAELRRITRDWDLHFPAVFMRNPLILEPFLR